MKKVKKIMQQEMKVCRHCRGTGEQRVLGFKRECSHCNGLGFIQATSYTLDDTQPMRAVKPKRGGKREALGR